MLFVAYVLRDELRITYGSQIAQHVARSKPPPKTGNGIHLKYYNVLYKCNVPLIV